MTDPAAAEAEPLLNRAQIAQIFDVSENTIDKWRSKGMPCAREGGNGVSYGFSAKDCRAWYEEHKAAQEAERRAADDFVAQQRMEFLGLKKDDQKAGLSPAQMRELAQAELVWMQAAERRRALVQVDEIVELLDQIFGEMRAGLDNLPDWMEREFSLTGEQVERVVGYCDGILKATQEAIAGAALDAAPDADVLDPADARLI